MTPSYYDTVVLVGVDGAGNFFRRANTPNIDRIFADGARTDFCTTARPSISAQCWGSMLLGVTPDVHGVSNATIGQRPHTAASPLPSVFRAIRESRPDALLASFCNWNEISIGLVENDIGVRTATGSDDDVTAAAVNLLRTEKPTFLFVQFDEVDEAGHHYGFGTADEYFAAIEKADREVGMIYDAIAESGAADKTLFLLDADHGGYLCNHGGWTEGERYVTYAAVGKTVGAGTIGEMEIRDNAAIILRALGIPQPAVWTARVPSGVFRGVSAGERPVAVSPEGAPHESVPTPDEAALRPVLGDYLLAHLPLDGNVDDVLHLASATLHGKIYYTDGWHGEAVRLDDGYLTVENLPTDGSFAVGAWIKLDRDAPGGTVFSAGEMRLDAAPDGFSFRFGTEELTGACRAGRWHHVVCAVDRRVGELRLFIDFHLAELRLLKEATIGSTLYVAAVSSEERQPLAAVLDDIVLWRYGFREYDAPGLAAYYGVDG